MKAIQYLDTGIFPATVMLVYKWSYKDLIAFMKKKKAKDWLIAIEGEQELIDSPNRCVCRRDIENKKTGEEKTLFYIFIKSTFDFSDYDYCKLAHEVTHLCQFILKDFLDRDKEVECEAYLHTHLMQQALKHIRHCNGK